MQAHHVRHVLYTAAQLQARVESLVEEMGACCRSENLVMLGILRGSFMFMADLVRYVNRHDMHPRIDFLMLSSYGAGTESAGQVRLVQDLTLDVRGADVVLVDDILDTGRTLAYAVERVRAAGAAVVRTCVLLDKPARRVVPFQADFTGFQIPDTFVVGYGLDYDSRYRELPHLAQVTFT